MRSAYERLAHAAVAEYTVERLRQYQYAQE
jgi:hypothetical protein